MNERPDPDQLLKRVQSEEGSAGRGRLKLFLGASPGVGKTYAMLEAARQRKKEGWDVAIGLVETHGRSDTEALLEGLEVLPRQGIPYKGVTLQEFDLDGALARRPRLLVLDELAHSNSEGLRHAKRWQDVEELLDAGIDVYTTLNVQHWESLNDVVAQITGVTVRETVPDTFLQKAHELELVDLSPEDLLQRLKEGKVYQGDLAGRAAEHFFKPGNLIALRELALRHAAERVDVQMQAFKERHDIDEVWSVGERLLVGVTASPMSGRLIRAASRLATRLRAPWLAVHVETSAFLRSSSEDRGRVVNNLRLAEKLGAEAVTLTGEDVPEELLALARERNVTRIILGKPAQPRWREWLFGSVVNNMARLSGNIDLHVISGVGTDTRRKSAPVAVSSAVWTRIGWGAAMVALSTLISWFFLRGLDRVNLVMIYMLGIMWTAYRFGRRAAFTASVLSVLCFDFFFVSPALSFSVNDAEYIVTFIVMLIAGLLISTITSRLRRQTVTLRQREARTRALYKLSRSLSETPNTQTMLQTAVKQLEEFYHRPILLLTLEAQGELKVTAGDVTAFGWTDNELSVARWVFDKAQMAGAGSDTLAGSHGLYLPLKGIRTTMGVLGIRPEDPNALMNPESLQQLETFAGEIGGALESTRMSEAAGRSEMQLEMQAIRQLAPGAPLRFGDFLSPSRIRLLPPNLPADRIIRELVARLDLPNPQQVFQAVMDREKTGSTLLGPQVAIPHARLEGLQGLHAALGISQEGPPYLWLLFVGPRDNPRLHLAFLSAISSFFKEEARVKDLLKLKSGKDILDYVRQWEVVLPA